MDPAAAAADAAVGMLRSVLGGRHACLRIVYSRPPFLSNMPTK